MLGAGSRNVGRRKYLPLDCLLVREMEPVQFWRTIVIIDIQLTGFAVTFTTRQTLGSMLPVPVPLN